jgi:Zn-dependent protease with chaperone function
MDLQHFKAHCYGAESAYSESVQVTVSTLGQLMFDFQGQPQQVAFSAINISDRLGNTPRFLDMPDGLRLETNDNDLIDRCIKQYCTKPGGGVVIHSIEKSLKWVFVFLLVVAVSVYSLYLYGIPLMAKIVSPVLPDAFRDLVSEQTLTQMDELMLDSTEMSEQQQVHYRALLASQLQPLVPELRLDLQFRSSQAMGANAFALPDGTLVFTDQLLTLLNDDEFLAIAAHEMGHVAADHGMRSVIASTSLLATVTLITGNSEAISEMLITAPTLLMQLSYSRDLEAEADDLAMDYMNQINLSLGHYVSAMTKLVNQSGADESGRWMTYLSTHPDPQERIDKFEQQLSPEH